MAKYHLSPTTGRPNKCYAEKRACPIGSSDEHYGSKEEAREAFERKMSADAVPEAAKKTASKPTADSPSSSDDFKEPGATASFGELADHYRSLLKDYKGEDRFDRIGKMQQRLEANLPAPPTAAEMMPKIATPEGFTRTETQWDAGSWGNQPPNMQSLLRLEGDGIKIEINFLEGDANAYDLGTGHVSFTSSQGTRTFDRRGVEDSFYVFNPSRNYSTADPTEGLNTTIQDFIDRKVPESRARIDGQEPTPGLHGRLVSEDQKQMLRDGKPLQLMPSGFGIGYGLSQNWHEGAREGSDEQKRFFGVKTLWISEFDCD